MKHNSNVHVTLLWRIAFTLLFCATQSLCAQDRVTVRSASGVRTYEGVIQNFSGKEGLVFKGRNDTLERFTVDRIVEINAKKSDVHIQAEDLFERGEYEAALELYRKAKAGETRSWMRQDIGSSCVSCLQSLGRFEEAVQEFFLITQSDPLSPSMSCMPLMWFSSGSFSGVISSQERLALQWLDSGNNPSGIENPAASLVAASILLSSSVQSNRGAAVRQLEKLTFLSSNDNLGDREKPENETLMRRQLALLANAQLWRTKLVALKTEKDFANWESIVSELQEPFRAGPYYLLAEAYAKVQHREKAVLHRMRVPIRYAYQRELAAKCLLESARDLTKLRRPREAQTLLEEIVRDYPEQKSFVQDARAELARLRDDAKNAPQPNNSSSKLL